MSELIRRGDLVTIAIGGDYGKPRPALIIQADEFDALPSVTVLRLTSEIHEEDLLRITVQPNKKNGLHLPSQICVDKAVSVPRSRISPKIGTLASDIMEAVNSALAVFLGL